MVNEARFTEEDWDTLRMLQGLLRADGRYLSLIERIAVLMGQARENPGIERGNIIIGVEQIIAVALREIAECQR